ncbi:fimbria/pilus outer membrane usher protein [Stenotrophomonas nitritireducens]|uniref:fimbria/pilus outer membrane usher protein n=1 Tax=Stenotrophomonas nitritireducens TaxID=83617 RepID=UPI00081BF420|nr:fimbria/pilus outer membrane usher protein [Stenotrophomonas nitritireducens]
MLPPRSLCLLLAASVAVATAAAAPPAPVRPPTLPDAIAVTAPQALELYLEVHINREQTGTLASFTLQGQTLSASASTLRQLGLRLPAGFAADAPAIALDQLPGTQASYDPRNQRLALQVPVQMLDRPATRLRAGPPGDAAEVSDSSPGLLLNYDLYAQQLRGDRAISGYRELRVFGLGAGTWSTSQTSRLSSGRAGRNTGTTRLDSYWQLDLPAPMLSLSVGDQLTGALDWSRSARIGGLHLSRNFSLQPYRVTTPLASFAGEAVLPSTVDLYINGVRQASQRVAPGRFQLDSTPALNGSGQAQLLVTDINGHSRSLEFALYGAPELLQPGLSDWSLDIGVLRNDYGLRSFGYDHRPLASASLRRGLSERLTLETHAEVARNVRLAGIGAVALLGRRGGVLDTSFSGSQADGQRGKQRTLGYQWNAAGFSISARTQRRSRQFVDAPAHLTQSLQSRRSDQLFVGFGSARSGQFSLNYILQDYPGSPRTRLLGAGWSRSLRGHAWVSAQFNRDLGRQGMDSAYLYVSVPLDRRTQLSTSLRHGADGDVLAVEANRSQPLDSGGWGWRVQTSMGAQRSQSAELNHLDEHGRWRLGLDHDNSVGTLAYLQGTGSVAWFGSGLHMLRRADDAFALVSTNGMPGVPVRLENRLVGTTDAHGELLVAPLRAWQRNLLSIDPLELPPDVQVDVVQQQVVPAARSGVRARFHLQPSQALDLRILGPDGHWLPAGTEAMVERDSRILAVTVIGHEGQLYLGNAPSGARLRIRHADGECVIALPGTATAAPSAPIEPLQCRP